MSANNAGVVCIAAAGNEGPDDEVYPSAWGEVMGVGASDKYGDRAIWDLPNNQYSNDLNVDIWAPGSSLATATIPGQSAYD